MEAMQNYDTSLIELDEGFSTGVGYYNDELDILDLGDMGFEATLCPRCQRFDIQSFAKCVDHRRGYLLLDVEAAAAEGCEFCLLLLASLKDIPRPTYFYMSFGSRRPTNSELYVHMTLSENYSEMKKQPGSLGLRVNRLQIEIGGRFSEVKNASKYELCVAADPESPAAINGDVLGRCLSGNPASDEHFATIRAWIQDCSVHSKCNQTVSGSISIDPYHSPLPARCLEVLQNGQDIFLRNTEGLYGSYITLTHRWSPETEICKTTTSNYQERLDGKGFENISRLFKDALVVAAKLDVRYVWIDSICIIQRGDEGADWRREAPKMAQYYQFSLLTVAGTMSDMRNGILSPADDPAPWAAKLVRLPYRDKMNTQQGYFYVYRRRMPLIDEYWGLVRKGILFRRGWILQEWLLSKRLLWYTPKGLFFECQTDMPRTDCQEKIQLEVMKTDLRSHLLQLKASFHFSNPDILAFWYQTLEIYSACHLTKPDQDRILAVAGVAKEIGAILAKPKNRFASEAELRDEVYLAGLWLRDIHHGLLWEEDHSAKPCPTRVLGIPSWSWASLMTPVKLPERGKGTEEAFKIIGVCLKARNSHDSPEHFVSGKRIIQRPDNDSTDSPTRGSQQLFDPLNLFSCLHIQGKLRTVHVRGYLETKENLYTAAFSTAYNATPKSCQWRAICNPARPEIIAGWGSLERMISDADTCSDFGTAVHALHVSTRYLRSGFGLSGRILCWMFSSFSGLMTKVQCTRVWGSAESPIHIW